MDIDQALHYAGILINKLEQLERRIGAGRNHDVKVQRAVLEGYCKMLEDKQGGKKYPMSTIEILGYLNEALQNTENFLARSV